MIFSQSFIPLRSTSNTKDEYLLSSVIPARNRMQVSGVFPQERLNRAKRSNRQHCENLPRKLVSILHPRDWGFLILRMFDTPPAISRLTNSLFALTNSQRSFSIQKMWRTGGSHQLRYGRLNLFKIKTRHFASSLLSIFQHMQIPLSQAIKPDKILFKGIQKFA